MKINTRFRDWLARIRDGTNTVKIPCGACGYDLRGLRRRGKCPECGSDLRPSFRDAFLESIRPRLSPIGWKIGIWGGASLVGAVMLFELSLAIGGTQLTDMWGRGQLAIRPMPAHAAKFLPYAVVLGVACFYLGIILSIYSIGILAQALCILDEKGAGMSSIALVLAGISAFAGFRIMLILGGV